VCANAGRAKAREVVYSKRIGCLGEAVGVVGKLELLLYIIAHSVVKQNTGAESEHKCLLIMLPLSVLLQGDAMLL
jgi:hypothetical protein